MSTNLLSPQLDRIIFVDVKVNRQVDDSDMVISISNPPFNLNIQGGLGRTAHPVTGTIMTVGRLVLNAHATSEKKDTSPIEVGVTAHAYFKHAEDVSEGFVDEFNSKEENVTRLLMQAYPIVLRYVEDRLADAGIPGARFPLGMPPRPEKDISQKQTKKPSSKRAKKQSSA